jgi:hypothetical protein
MGAMPTSEPWRCFIMPKDDERALIRRIVEAYRRSGIPAKSHRGKLLIHRESGWEGPLDPYELQESYLDEIGQIERDVRVAAAECYNRYRKYTLIDNPGAKLVIGSGFILKALLMRSGLEETKAILYSSVASHLHSRGDLWSQEGEI